MNRPQLSADHRRAHAADGVPVVGRDATLARSCRRPTRAVTRRTAPLFADRCPWMAVGDAGPEHVPG